MAPAQAPDIVESEQVNDNDLPPQSDDDILPVVGLGGSAGSIQALQQFFESVRPDLGLAYVVVIHLSPDYKSSLAEIIGARTSMKVVQVTEAVQIAPNCVYVIPPSHHLSMRDSKLYLSEPQQERGQRVAVDLLFRTLAATHRSKAVAVVLSGSDADGSVGIKRIKEHGGVTVSQDPDEAEFDGMPRSAIETGMVDWILPVRQIAEKVAEWIQNERAIRLPTPEQVTSVSAEEADVVALREILSFLHARTGQDFVHYKRATVLRRIGRRLQVNSLTTLPQYADYMRTHPGEAGALLQDLLISVTNFFRDPTSFGILESHIPALFREKSNHDTVRVWIAGCATGEEAYSVAMLLTEYADTLERAPDFQLFATDLDENALQVARDGLYPQSIVADVSPDRLLRFFTLEQGRYRIKKELRERVLFAPHNLLQDAPFSRLDLVTCRNLLIYFNPEAQQRVLGVFHFALRSGGMLFLGTSESAENNPLFVAIDRKHSLYRRQGDRQVASPPPSSLLIPRVAPVRELVRLRHLPESANPLSGGLLSPPPPLSPTQIHEQLLMQVAPPSILVNSDYGMVRIANNARRYVQHVEGEVSNNVLQAVPPALRLTLRTALFSALQTRQSIEVAPVLVELEGQPRRLSVRVQPQAVPEGTPVAYAALLFQEEAPNSPETVPLAPSASEETVQRLEDELQHLRDYLRSTIEEHEVASEELKAYNEELQALNEEQRSAAEELETSREEIQASNEELNTVNAELKLKIDEVGRANSDLQNLMASTDIATVFLSRDLRIKRYTPLAVELFNFIPTDTGRPLTDLKHNVNDEHFAEDAARVLRTLVSVEREVSTSQGQWFLSRIAPYRTLDDKIDGVVLTLVDITKRREAEERLRQTQTEQAFLLQMGDALRPLIDPVEIQSEAARLIGRHLGASRASYAEVEADDAHFVVERDYTNGVPSYAGRYLLDSFGPGFVQDMRAGRTVMLADAENDARLNEAERAALAAGTIQAFVGVPLVKQGQLSAVFSLHFPTPHEWTTNEVALAEDTAERTWAAVERARAENALAHSEEKYRTLFDSIDEGFCIFELVYDDLGNAVDWIYTEANPAFEKQTGYLNPIGKRISEFQPDLERSWFEQFARVARTGESLRFVQYTAAMGIWYDVYAISVGGAGSNRVSLLFTDVTERKRRETNQAFLLKLSDSLRSLSDPVAVQETAMQILGEHLNVQRAFYGELMDDADTLNIGPGYSHELSPLVGYVKFSEFDSDLVSLYRRGQTVIINDLYEDITLSAQAKAAFDSILVRAAVGVPLVKDEKVEAILSLHQSTPRQWTPDEIRLTEEVAERTWAAGERARTETELQERMDELTRFNQAMVQRELRMIELKKEVNALCEQQGQEKRYPLEWENEGGATHAETN